MITAIIVDDEVSASQNLLKLLNQHCRQVEVLKIYNSPFEALENIVQLQPSLLFLDIEMPGMDGFELLEKLENVKTAVIFTTAFNQYAIRAIQFSALDYILKPILTEELVKAVNRYEVKKSESNSIEQMKALLENLKNPKSNLHKIAIPTFDGMVFLNLQDIIRLEAEGSYTRFHTRQGQYLVSRSLKEYDDLLSENDFLRVHHGHLININQVNRYVKNDGGYIILQDGSNVPISSRKKAEVVERLSHF